MKSGKNDTVLLKIKREFEETEAVRFLSAELSKAKFKIGELMSEISELKHIIKLQKEEAARLNDCLHQKIKIHPDHSTEVKRLNKLLSEKGTVIKRLTDEIDLLLSRSVVQKNSSLPPQTSSPAGEGAVVVEGAKGSRFGPQFIEAAKLVVEHQAGSVFMLQRRMKMGYNRACDLMVQLEALGIVSPILPTKVRDVLVKSLFELELLLESKEREETNDQSTALPLPESNPNEPSRGIVAEDSTDALMEQLRKSEIN